MTSEQIEFLKQFDSRLDVAAACYHTFGQGKHFAVPAWIVDAFKEGLLVRGLDARGYADDEPVIDSQRIYGREFMLTDKGRFAVGLPVAKPAKVTPKSRGLFDD